MSKPVKISLALLALILVALTGLVVFAVTLDPNDHKDFIADRFRQQTGLELSIAGPIGLTLYPWLGVSVEQVAVANREGFGDRALLETQRASVRIKTMPLLRGRYEIDTIVLHGGSVNLVVDESGAANWSTTTSAAGSAPESGSGSGNGFNPANLVIGGVDIQNARVRYEDRRSGAVYELDDIAIAVDELVYGAPVNLIASLLISSNQPQLSGTVELGGVVNYDVDNGRYALAPLELTAQLSGATLPQGSGSLQLTSAVEFEQREDSMRVSELRLAGLGAELNATLLGTGVSSNRATYEAEVTATGTDLAALFRAVGIEPLATQLTEVRDRSFALQADLRYESGRQSNLAVNVEQARLLDASLTGNMNVTNLSSGQPAVDGQLVASGPDFPLLVEVLGQLSGGSDSILTNAGSQMRGVSDRSFSVEARFDADAASGTVLVPTLDATIIGASISGNLDGSDLQTDQPKISGSLSATGPDLPLMLGIAGSFQGGGGTDSELSRLAERLGSSADRSFSANADFDIDLGQGNVSVPAVNARALGLTLAGRVQAQDMSSRTGRIEGELSLIGDRPRALLTALDQAELAEVLQRLSLTVQLSGSRENLSANPLRAELVLAGARIPQSPATLTLDSATRIDLNRETLSIESFRATGLGLDASGNIEVERLLDAPTFQGRLTVGDFNLRRFMEQLGQPLPETADSAVLQTVGLNTDFSGSTASIALSGLELTLDQTRLRGEISVANFDTFPAEFNLDIDGIDLDRYLPPAAATASTPSQTGQPASGALPVDMLRDLQVLGDLSIGALTVAGVNLADLNVSVNAADGQLNLAPVSTSLYEGVFEGSVRLSVADEVPVAHVEADMRQVNLEGLLLDMMDASYVSGRGNVALSLTGRGDNTDAIKRSLSGNGRVQLEDGVFQGVDVAGVLNQLEAMIRSRRAGTLQRGEQTAFDTFSATLTMTDGVIRSNDLLIRSPGFQVAGRGTLLNLADESITFDLVTSVDSSTATRNDQQYDIGGYSVPIACSGTLAAPRCLPDAGEILRNAVQRELQDRVTDLLDRAIGNDSQTQDAPATSTPPTSPQQGTQQQPQQPEQPQDLREQLIDRALNRIFN